MNNNTNKFDTCFTIAMQKILKGEGKVFFQGEHQIDRDYIGLDSSILGGRCIVHTVGCYGTRTLEVSALTLNQKYRMVTKEDF